MNALQRNEMAADAVLANDNSKKVSTFLLLMDCVQSTIDILSARFGFDSCRRREGAELIGW